MCSQILGKKIRERIALLSSSLLHKLIYHVKYNLKIK